MSAMQRTKGQSGEREVAHILSAALGISVTRNWETQFDGGACDLKGLPGWAIEVKRAKAENVWEWWEQAKWQAKEDLKPALIYRIDGYGRGKSLDEKWQVVISIDALLSELAPIQAPTTLQHHYASTITMPLRTWLSVLIKTGKYSTNESMVPF